MAEPFDSIRDKDHVVLSHIRDGNDIQQITEATSLSNQEVNYSFRKLENLDLIEIHKREGTVERVIDGQKRVFPAPKQATLTEKGLEYFEWTDREGTKLYEDITREEMVERIHELEERLDELETKFDIFTKQIRRELLE
ncbi:MAG: hypothetical protein ABEJ69_03620 [Candidatus Nanohaloarchaea archaeon]